MIGLAPVSMLLSGKQEVLMLCCHMGGNEQEGCSHRITHSNSLSTLYSSLGTSERCIGNTAHAISIT